MGNCFGSGDAKAPSNNGGNSGNSGNNGGSKPNNTGGDKKGNTSGEKHVKLLLIGAGESGKSLNFKN
jgi:hypothetical protein